MPRSVHVVPHTHWDREWYDPYPTFRLRLVDLLDELLPRLEEDPSFAHFQLDGQMAAVDDYLEVRPEEAERLQRLSAEGRLSMGPWYVLPDEFLVSGETLVRNLQLGLARAEQFGGAMAVGYLPDMFGHIAAMPQLLAQFGLEHAVVWRGVPLSIDAPAFWWESPDGSRVRAEYLSAGYGNGSDMPADAATLGERMDIFLGIQGTLVGERLLWMAGMDHEVPPAHLSRVVAELDAAGVDDPDGYALTIGSLSDYLAEAPTEGLPVHRGELRSGARANLLMGVASNRVDVKIAAARAERSLERLAEPLLALWSANPRRAQPLLDVAWLEVIRNAAHDSICACSHDEVVDAVLHRYAESIRTATGLAERAVKDAESRLAEPGVHLLNPGARPRNEVVEIDVPGPYGGDPIEHPALQILSVRPPVEELYRSPAAEAPVIVAREMIFEHPSTSAVRFEERTLDDGTTLLEVHLLPEIEDGVELTEVHAEGGADDTLATGGTTMTTADGLGALGRRCDAEPELLVATVLHRDTPSRRALTMSGPVAGYGWTRWQPTLPEHPVVAAGELGLGNGLLEVRVDATDGTFAVDGVAGYGRLVDDGDAGDTYNWSPPEVQTVVDAPTSVRVEVLEQGSLRGRVLIEAEYLLPYEVAEATAGEPQQRVGEVAHLLRTTLELRADEPFLRVSTHVDNRSRDHRLRVHLPLPQRATTSLAECAYGLVERPLDAEGGPNEWGVPTYPSRRFVQAGGLTVTHEGLCEYELVDLSGDAGAPGTSAGELALTLVRATGWLSRGPMASRPLPAGPEDRLEGAQTLKPLTLQYTVSVGEQDAYAQADQAWSPLVVANAPGGGDLPAEGSHLQLTGAEVDAVLTDPDGSLVVRVHEPAGTAGAVEIAGRRGDVIDLRGQVVATFDGRAELRPHQILTVRLDPSD